jgi:hypothetical protein
MGLSPLSRALGVSRDIQKAKIKILADESYMGGFNKLCAWS